MKNFICNKRNFLVVVASLFIILFNCAFVYADEEPPATLENSFFQSVEPILVQEGETAIIIESKKPKMDVYLNGIYQGKTKLKITSLLPGEYFIELKKGEKSTGKKVITVKRGYTLTYKFSE